MPESVFNGKIILLNFPVNEYHEGGLMVQVAFKYLFQRAVLRRSDLHRGAACGQVFLWEDESHNYLIDYDPEFQRVAREYKVCRVFMTQNINNLYDRFGGGPDAQVKTNSLLSNFGTRIFHANSDHATNTWASDMLGTTERRVIETSRTPASCPGLNPLMDLLYRAFKLPTVSTSERVVREPHFHAHQFLELLPGGQKHDFTCSALITQVGRLFDDGLPYRVVGLRQAFPWISQSLAVRPTAPQQS